MIAPVVLLERPAEGVALIRINRPESRNALNIEVRKLLAQYLTEPHQRSDVLGRNLQHLAKLCFRFIAAAEFDGPAELAAFGLGDAARLRLQRLAEAAPDPRTAAIPMRDTRYGSSP